MFLSVAAVALAILCNGAFNIVLSGVGLFIKGAGSIFHGIGLIIAAILEGISKLIIKLMNVFLDGNQEPVENEEVTASQNGVDKSSEKSK
jgi:hypothetical protein